MCHNYFHYYTDRGIPLPIPATPILEVEVLRPDRKKKCKVKCKLDSGSHITVIPQNKIDDLQLRQSEEKEKVEDFYGKIRELPAYRVHLLIPDYDEFCGVMIIPTNKDVGLIGRDILNKCVLILDGAKLKFCLWDNCECKFIANSCIKATFCRKE